MDPNTIPNPSFDLPRPAANEAAATPNVPASEVSAQTENRNMEMPAAPAPAPIAPPTAAPAPAYQQPQAAPTAPVAANPTSATPVNDDLAAEDSDLIEKAWVTKAKAIVEQTKADPHTQNKEINKVKSEYIKKRYGKDIKLNNEQAA